MIKRALGMTAAFVLLSSVASAAAPKTYQVTGPIDSLTDSTITVLKGKEKWEIARDPSTKVDGELKVGAKVTIEYRMTATTITVKPAAAAKKAK